MSPGPKELGFLTVWFTVPRRELPGSKQTTHLPFIQCRAGRMRVCQCGRVSTCNRAMCGCSVFKDLSLVLAGPIVSAGGAGRNTVAAPWIGNVREWGRGVSLCPWREFWAGYGKHLEHRKLSCPSRSGLSAVVPWDLSYSTGFHIAFQLRACSWRCRGLTLGLFACRTCTRAFAHMNLPFTESEPGYTYRRSGLSAHKGSCWPGTHEALDSSSDSFTGGDQN